MSYCNDPHLLPINGKAERGERAFSLSHSSESVTPRTGFTSAGGWLGRLEPSFSMSKLRDLNGDILWPASIQYDLNPPHEPVFSAKTQHKIVWRGSPDGTMVVPWNDWRRSHRFRLIALGFSNDTSDIRTVRMTRTDRVGREYQVDIRVPLADLNERYSNLRPSAPITQGDPEYCAKINHNWKYVKPATLEEMAEHRYVMDVDGNA